MSEIKVNKISPRSGTTVTLGDSGDTFTIPAGATINNQGTATNFGATGSASWNTTVKTGDFTAVAGEGYFVNTTSGAITVTLPAGSAGAVVAIKDYAGTFDSNACTIDSNGSEKIGGSTNNATLSTEGLAVTFIYIDSTQGWLVTDDGLQSVADTNPFIVATGGTVTCCGDYKIHTFTGPGTFEVTAAGSAAGSTELEYIVAAGGGQGGVNRRGGGGAGGFRFASPSLAPLTYPGKPLAAPAALTASVASFPITVGAGAVQRPNPNPTPPTGYGLSGSPSTFSTITSAGGGGGSCSSSSNNLVGGPGGSGGGGYGAPGCSGTLTGGVGNTPPVSPAQGRDGGDGNAGGGTSGGGGGGAINEGADQAPSGDNSALGGDGAGIPTGFGSNGVPCGSYRYYAGGGAGGSGGSPAGPRAGGKGGGGNGGFPGANATAGTTNSGGGGGAGGQSGFGAAGGSGIVIIRYKFQ